MPEIVLATLNAKYAHASFGLRYLLANLGELRPRAQIAEFEISDRSCDIVEELLKRSPRILGLGIYIWNVEQSTRVVAELKRVAPEITIILGGPEVSYETEGQPIVDFADYVICGEGDLTLPKVCAAILDGQPPADKLIAAELPQFAQLKLPYDCYTEQDIAHRVIYVEASRGCPYECEFCLSSLEIPVRQAALDEFLAAMETLLERGVRQFKFVDRTFNLNLRASRRILEFFLERQHLGLFLHFEMIPDRLPEALREPIRQFAPGALQFEVGIQTFNPEVGKLISRRQDYLALEENLRFLRDETGVHVHADLIVGLPGETAASFGEGFNRLVRMRPQEIQVGMLKRLRGTPIMRHDGEWGMTYSPHPPYEILQTRLIDFAAMQRLRRFARYWDLVANSGNFVESTPLLWERGEPFDQFLRFSDWLYEASGQTNGIALKRLAEFLFRFLVEQTGCDEEQTAQSIWRDYQRGGRSDRPPFLRQFTLEFSVERRSAGRLPRQARHGETVRE